MLTRSTPLPWYMNSRFSPDFCLYTLFVPTFLYPLLSKAVPQFNKTVIPGEPCMPAPYLIRGLLHNRYGACPALDAGLGETRNPGN